MKSKIIAAAVCAVLLLTLGGCDFSDLSSETMLRPPKTMGDEAEIEQLISASAEGDYVLKYPKSGSYRSAIIMKDLDGDDVDEAIAFFRSKDAVTSLHMLVMYESDGHWQISGDFVNESTDVDCVEFSDIDEGSSLEILAGFTTYTPNVSFLTCYSFNGSTTGSIQCSQTYSSFCCGNLDGEGKNEIVTLSLYNADNEARASMLAFTPSKNALFVKSSVAMDPNVVRYKSVVFADIASDVKGVAVDGSLATEEVETQLIYYNKQLATLRNPLYREKEKNYTLRSCPVLCADVDNEPSIEFPRVEKLPHKDSSDAAAVADRLIWCGFDVTKEAPVPKLNMASNYAFNYTIKIPASWENGSYTAINSEEKSSMTLCEWYRDSPGQSLFEIKVFDSSEWEKGKGTDDFKLIYRDNRYAYSYRNYYPDSALALSDDDIKKAFSILNTN